MNDAFKKALLTWLHFDVSHFFWYEQNGYQCLRVLNLTEVVLKNKCYVFLFSVDFHFPTSILKSHHIILDYLSWPRDDSHTY